MRYRRRYSRPKSEYLKPGYFRYGEGSVTHGDKPCEHGIGLHHPQIERMQWPSRRAYHLNKIARWWWGHRISQWGRALPRLDKVPYPVPTPWPNETFMDRLIRRTCGDAFPKHPRVWAPLAPKDSIYLRGEEDARIWEKIRAESGESA